MLQYFGSDN